MNQSNSTNNQGGYDPEAIKAAIIAEFADLKDTVNSFGFEAIKDGSWFVKFVESCLSSYEQRVMEQGGVSYLRSKYPGLPTDAIAGKLCELAESNAALAGGLSGAAASAAVLTGGLAVPAAVTGVMAEVFYTVRLQLRLAYDLHLLYGVPLDAKDPEELFRLFSVVYGIKIAEMGGIAVKKFGPEVVRAQLFRLINGNTPVIQAAVRQVLGPRIAKQITQKAIIKTAVPIVGTAISAGWNYATTRMMATRVRHGVRVSAALREETKNLQGQIGRNQQAELAVLEGLMALALADKEFDDKERDVYLTFLQQLGLPEDEMNILAEKVNADLDLVCDALRGIKDPANRNSVARCFCLIVAADGEVESAEQEVLERLLQALEQQHLMEELPSLIQRFRRDDSTIDQTLFAIGDVANSAGAKVGEAIGWASKFFQKEKPPETTVPEVNFEISIEERTNAIILEAMDKLAQRFAKGEISQDDYRSQFEMFVQQLKK